MGLRSDLVAYPISINRSLSAESDALGISETSIRRVTPSASIMLFISTPRVTASVSGGYSM